MNEASQMRSGFVSAPPLEMRDDVISMSMSQGDTVVERIRRRYGEMERQRHVDRF